MARGRWLLVPCMLLGSAAVEAAPDPVAAVRLRYERDASAGRCPDEATLRAAVAGRVGFAPFDESAERVIACRVQKVGRVLRARIHVADRDEQPGSVRELVSLQDDCQELAEAITLALGIAIDPLTTAASPAVAPTEKGKEKPATDEPPRPRAEAGAAAVVTTSASPAHPRAFTLRLGARGDAAVGLGPGLAYGAALTLGLERRALSAGMELRVLAPSSATVGRGTLSVWQWSILLVPCVRRGGVAGCLVGSAGMMYGRAEGFASNGRASGPTLAAGGRAAWAQPLLGEHLQLAVTLDVVAAVTRTRFTVGDSAAWRPAPVGACLGIGMQGAFF